MGRLLPALTLKARSAPVSAASPPSATA